MQQLQIEVVRRRSCSPWQSTAASRCNDFVHPTFWWCLTGRSSEPAETNCTADQCVPSRHPVLSLSPPQPWPINVHDPRI